MKLIKKIVTVVLLLSIQLSNAATFRILNDSGEAIKVRPSWNKAKEDWIKLEYGETSKEYNTQGHKLQKVEWCVGTKMYDADLKDIDSRVMLKKYFAILKDGKFEHTFFIFSYEPTEGKAQLDPKPCTVSL